ncbi:MAG: hypothetical protein S4CHLAM81_03010 [Chlamydiales bacterium]|nr:hypothetical protein [Chlamydiales bacterium]MCH9635091.1 hypothetical protein [Chlamydiales bacterium]
MSGKEKFGSISCAEAVGLMRTKSNRAVEAAIMVVLRV